MAAAERSCFEQDRGGFVGHLGIETTHHACQCNSLCRRSDHAHIRRERALFPIERGELLAVFSRTHDDVDLAILVRQLVVIEGMERLAEQEQDIVRRIDDVVDRTSTRRSNALRQPIRAWTHLHVLDHARSIAIATCGIRYGHLDRIRGRLKVLVLAQVEDRIIERIGEATLIHGPHLARHALHGKAIRAIRRDLEIEDLVVELHIVRKGLAYGRIGRQDHDAIVIGTEP